MSHTGQNLIGAKILLKYEGMPVSMENDREEVISDEEMRWVEWCVHCPHFFNGCMWPKLIDSREFMMEGRDYSYIFE